MSSVVRHWPNMHETMRVFIEAWKVLTGRLPGPSLAEGKGLVTCFGNVPLLFFNLSMVSEPVVSIEGLRGVLATAAARGKSCPHPTGVVLREDWLPAGWEAVVQEVGLAPMVPLTGMEGGELLPPRRPKPPELEIRRVSDAAMARELAEINALAYAMPVEGFDCIATMKMWPADSQAYVGYVDGQAVSCAAALPAMGTVYIAMVATRPGAQGKGYAEHVMREAVTQMQQAMGTTVTTLHASDMGLPVYRAMGYTAGARMVLVGPAH